MLLFKKASKFISYNRLFIRWFFCGEHKKPQKQTKNKLKTINIYLTLIYYFCV